MRHLVVALAMALLLSSLAVGASLGAPAAYVTNAGTDNNGNSVAVVDTSKGTLLSTIQLGLSPVMPFGVAILPDGSRLYVTNFSAGTVSVIDVATNQPIGAPIQVGMFPAGVAASPSGSRVYVVSTTLSGKSLTGRFSVINTDTNAVVGSLSLNGAIPFGVAVNPKAPRAYVADRSGHLRVLDISTDTARVVADLSIGRDLHGVDVAPDGKRIYVADYGGGWLLSVSADSSTDSYASLLPIPVGRNPFGVAVSPKGDHVYVTNEKDNTVSVIDTTTPSGTHLVGVGFGPRGIAVASDGSYIYVANWGGGSLSIIRANDLWKLPDDMILPSGSSPIAFGKFLMPAPQVITVQIDIMPGGNPNVINTKSRGTTPVALLGSPDYAENYVTMVDVASLRLAGAPVHKKPNGAYMASFEDVNEDGLVDLVVHFETEQMKVAPGDTRATLEGQLLDGRAITGADSIRVTP